MESFFTTRFKTVLIIDDDEFINVFNRRFLERLNFADQIITCDSPEDALAYLSACRKENVPEVIISDINMPTMNGFEFIEHLVRLKINLSRTGIFMLSSSRSDSDKENMEKYPQITGYIEKPLNAEKIKDILRNYSMHDLSWRTESRTLVYYNDAVYLIR
jgi:response regulator RpfG family c-di-GMP phosphodiesterase